MADPNDPPHYDTDRVRAGATPGVMRYVLAISLTLIVVIYAVYLLI